MSEALQFGEIHSANITNDSIAGIGKLTDGQLLYFIRTGIVCTSRLIVSDHMPFQIYAGIFFGMISEFIAYAFIGI